MSLLKGYIVPHPPILVMGSEEEKAKLAVTYAGFKEINEELKVSEAELVILITPHGPLFVDGLCVYDKAQNSGNFSAFGHKDITGLWDNDLSYINDLQSFSLDKDIPFVKLDPQIIKEFNLSSELDHGAMVPLKLLEEGIGSKKVVIINYGLLPVDTLYHFGQLLTRTLAAEQKNGIVIASGDLSHCLLEEGPYGYRSEGVEFDSLYVKAFEDNRLDQLLFVEEHLLERASECGKRSIDILLGAFDGIQYETTKFSYQSPFGVGYLTGRLSPVGGSIESKLPEVINQQAEIIRKRVSEESDVVKLARKGIRYYLEEDKIYRPKEVLNIEESGQRFGVFVSLNDMGGLRGCIGSTGGIAPRVEEEIVEMGVKAATNDPRFEGVSLEELGKLTISVDILSRSEQVINIKELDPKVYGVIAKSNHKQGLLLPDLEGIDTIESQLEIVLNKAGIDPKEETYQLYKFTVKRFY